MTDITLAITLHAETTVAIPSIRSAEACIRAAEAAGLSVERLMAFDTPTDECRNYFARTDLPSRWDPSEFAFRDQGRTRNALAERARGRWLAFLDGDDLFSENWLVEAAKCLRQAEQADEKIIVHPELNLFFDAALSSFVKINQSDPLFCPYYFCVENYYDALCMAPTMAWLKHPYPSRAIADGFAYEDWQWNIETMAAGWRHVAARDTIIFKRRRDSSQSHESRQHKACIRALEAMAVDQIMSIPKTNTLQNMRAT